MNSAGHDHAIRYLLLARGLRDFGDGFVAVLLPVYLTALGFSTIEIGLIATAALVGSALLTIAIGLVGRRHEYRRLLMAVAGLMIATGLAIASVHDFVPLLVIAFAGTINPSTGSVGAFVPLEHAALSREVSHRDRTKLFARYSLIGSLAAAFGALAAASPDYLELVGIDQLAAVKLMFVVYAALGLVGGILYTQIPPPAGQVPSASPSSLGPSRNIVFRLAALFSLDAFAGGLAVQSLLALWLFERFDLSLTGASAFFFWSGLLSATSFPVAAWLSGRIGLVNTMVFTHIPSSLFLILAAVAPTLPLALAFLLARAALSQMDVPTRSSYVMAVVTEEERPAAASFTAVPRSLAAAPAPAIAGLLMATSFLALPLVLCGALKIAYDLLLLGQFRHVKPPEEV